jgi:hypothetical protein
VSNIDAVLNEEAAEAIAREFYAMQGGEPADHRIEPSAGDYALGQAVLVSVRPIIESAVLRDAAARLIQLAEARE